MILVEAKSKSHDAILNLESLKFKSSVSLLSISKGLTFLVVFFFHYWSLKSYLTLTRGLLRGLEERPVEAPLTERDL